jgi:molybdopterin synthase sulfur carrier subunit
MIRILFFGRLTEFVGQDVLEAPAEGSITDLKEYLYTKFPTLENETFQISVNQQIVDGKYILHENDEVAFLPPFAGG